MIKKRRQKGKQNHYALLLNRRAGGFERRVVERLTAAIRRAGAHYTVLEPESATDLLAMAQQAAGVRRRHRFLSQNISRRGPITALVACGGDGTFNLVARAAMDADLPVGVLPLGSLNNIARSLCGSVDPGRAIQSILSGNYRKFDAGRAATQPFFGSVGLGFTAELTRLLKEKKLPRFGIGWAQLANRAAASVSVTPIIVKVDSFRFEVSPLMLNVNLLSYSAGLPFSPASVPDDGHAEVIFDRGEAVGGFGAFARLIHNGKYLYGDDVRMYRATTITCQPSRGRKLYLDGELIDLPTNVLEVQVKPQQVKVFC
ncbi:MAG TPA: diacylglycerol kinase family protein [Acidobacteriota bacterium]|nr:diacylglycerol kinase family protein [Acidobacteriota bacterium]